MDSSSSRINYDDLFSVRIDGLSRDVTNDDLRSLFDKYGKIEDVYIPRDNYSGGNKGFGFVRYVTEAEAHDAVKENGEQFMGQQIRVEYAGKRPPRRQNRNRSRSYDRHRHRSSSHHHRRRSYSRSRSYSRHHDSRRRLSRSYSRDGDSRRRSSRRERSVSREADSQRRGNSRDQNQRRSSSGDQRRSRS